MNNKEKYLNDIHDLNKLDNMSPNIDMESLSNIDEIEDIKEVFDFNNLYTNAENEASEYVDSLIKHYIDDNAFNIDYIKKRIDIDKLNLTNCIYQMKSSKVALTKILEIIDSGVQATPQMFKSLTDLEKSNLEILKYFKTYIQILEREYESISVTYKKDDTQESQKNLSTTGDKILVKSQKDMVEKIREHKKEHGNEE